MKNSKFRLFSLLAILSISVFMTSCEQDDVSIHEEETLTQEASILGKIERATFIKNLTIGTPEVGEVELTVSTDEPSLLDLVNTNSFKIEPIYEIAALDDGENEELLKDNNELYTEDTPLLMVSVNSQDLPDNAIGVKILLKENETVNSRYNRISYYYFSSFHKKIYTRNKAYTSIKMKYYDDHRYAGYQSLCSGPCSSKTYRFKRYDKGVGCRYEFWSWGHSNVDIVFYN